MLTFVDLLGIFFYFIVLFVQGSAVMGKIVRPRIKEMPRSIDRCSFVYIDQASIK